MKVANRFWSLIYSFSSLRRQPLKNIGIAIFLAFNIAIPTTVFAWTDTSVYIAIENHFSENSYQLLATTNLRSDYTILESLQGSSASYDVIQSIDYFPSTVGILTNSNLRQWSTYFPNSPMPAVGINDFRIIPVTNKIVQQIAGEFVWIGNQSMSENEVLISERFVYHVRRTHEIELVPGMIIDFDILSSMPTDRRGNILLGYSWNTNPIRKENYTIAGIYKLKSLQTLLSQAFPSFLRPDPWPEHQYDQEAVLGLEDSVMILRDEIESEVYDRISLEGYFTPVTLFRGDIDVLAERGPKNIEDNLSQAKTLIEDANPRLFVIGSSTLSEIQIMIEAFERGQMLTLVALPIIFLSLFVTVYTTQSSLTHRKLEVTVLRAKGASYNQITSSIMFESVLLSILGFSLGMVFTLLLTPIIGSSQSLFQIDFQEFLRFLYSIRISYVAIALAITLSLFLPGLYIYQIERKINVFEIGNPTSDKEDEEISESSPSRYVILLIIVIAITTYLPLFLDLFQLSPTAGILIITVSLVVGSVLGSRVIQLGISNIYSKYRFNLGEKAIYVFQSLRRRRGKFIPLMIILTLSLTCSTMMLIQTSSYSTTIHNDVVYSFGADIRAEAYVPYPYSIALELEEKERVNLVTPVTRHVISHNDYRMYMIGVDAIKYLEIGTFTEDTFPGREASEVLETLDKTTNGVVIPRYYADLLGLDVGDEFDVRVINIWLIRLTIVGIMESAPGFGDAYQYDSDQETIVSNLGFQTMQDGFILVNFEDVAYSLWVLETDLFLIDVDIDAGFTDVYDEILSEYRFDLKTPHWNLLPERERIIVGEDSIYYSRQLPVYFEIDRFTRGLQGIGMVCIIASMILAVSSIGLFFGSAINERRSEYAIIRAMGAKQEDVYSIVANEFAVLVITTLLVSLGLGVVFGYTATMLILDLAPYTPLLNETISLPFLESIIVFGLEFLSLIVACYLPARRAARLNVLQELRNL